MYAGKILAGQAVGRTGYSWTDGYPFLIFIGPSGNVCHLPKPNIQRVEDGSHYIYETDWDNQDNFGSRCLAWCGKELLFRETVGVDSIADECIWAFCPYGLSSLENYVCPPSGIKYPRIYMVAALGDNFSNAETHDIIQDAYYKRIARLDRNYNESLALLSFIDGVHIFDGRETQWFDLFKYAARYIHHTQHRWHSAEELYEGSGYIAIPGQFAWFYGEYWGGIETRDYGGRGIQYYDDDFVQLNPTYIEFTIPLKVVHYKGIFVAVTDDSVGIVIPGVPSFSYPSLILAQNTKDIEDSYTNRYYCLTYWDYDDTTPYGVCYKYPFIYNGELFFLQNDGKILKLDNGYISLVCDVRDYFEAPHGSGIFGGKIGYEGWKRNSYMCFAGDVGGRLYVFLNYLYEENGKQRRGVFCASTTNFDEWTDHTFDLPSSGIIPPSGMNLTTYLGIISPYRFSGYNNFDTVANGQPSGINGPAIKCEPSGWCQRDGIKATWQGSGTFYNCDYDSSPSSWDIPMRYQSITRYLAPTYTIEPTGFDNNLRPVGVANSGYNWVGVTNYHILGWKDETDDRLHLFFVEDEYAFQNNTYYLSNSGVSNQVLYYVLDSNGNFIFRNQFQCKQLMWIEPTDMHEPAVVLTSGTYYERFPKEDRINRVVWQPFRIYDYPFFRNVNIEVQYTTDYINWYDATPHSTLSCPTTNLSTGDISTDPSGIIGKEYMFAWDYTKDIGSRSILPYVQLRIRAYAND